jgi:hypothetical protein
MKKNLKRIAITLLIVFIVIQFMPTKRNQNTELLVSDFTKTYDVPNNIQKMLKAACYDCHSNNTKYPWYNKIQPVAWFIEHHIDEAKEELNFSEFGSYSSKKQNHKLDEIMDEVKEGKMPLKTYKVMHSEAKFSNDEKEAFINWFESKLK